MSCSQVFSGVSANVYLKSEDIGLVVEHGTDLNEHFILRVLFSTKNFNLRKTVL